MQASICRELPEYLAEKHKGTIHYPEIGIYTFSWENPPAEVRSTASGLIPDILRDIKIKEVGSKRVRGSLKAAVNGLLGVKLNFYEIGASGILVHQDFITASDSILGRAHLYNLRKSNLRDLVTSRLQELEGAFSRRSQKALQKIVDEHRSDR